MPFLLIIIVSIAEAIKNNEKKKNLFVKRQQIGFFL